MSGPNRERSVLFGSPACLSSLAEPGRGWLSRDIPAEERGEGAFSLHWHPLHQGQLQPSNTPCVSMAFCHLGLQAYAWGQQISPRVFPTLQLLVPLSYDSLPITASPPIWIPFWEALGRRYSTEPPVLLEEHGVCYLPALLHRSKSSSSAI